MTRLLERQLEELATRYGVNVGNGTVRIDLSQYQMAQMLDCSRGTVGKQIRQLDPAVGHWADGRLVVHLEAAKRLSSRSGANQIARPSEAMQEAASRDNSEIVMLVIPHEIFSKLAEILPVLSDFRLSNSAPDDTTNNVKRRAIDGAPKSANGAPQRAVHKPRALDLEIKKDLDRDKKFFLSSSVEARDERALKNGAPSIDDEQTLDDPGSFLASREQVIATLRPLQERIDAEPSLSGFVRDFEAFQEVGVEKLSKAVQRMLTLLDGPSRTNKPCNPFNALYADLTQHGGSRWFGDDTEDLKPSVSSPIRQAVPLHADMTDEQAMRHITPIELGDLDGYIHRKVLGKKLVDNTTMQQLRKEHWRSWFEGTQDPDPRRDWPPSLRRLG